MTCQTEGCNLPTTDDTEYCTFCLLLRHFSGASQPDAANCDWCDDEIKDQRLTTVNNGTLIEFCSVKCLDLWHKFNKVVGAL